MKEKFLNWCKRNRIPAPDDLDIAHFIGQYMKQKNLYGIEIFDSIKNQIL